jgi:hypothetical protein
VTLKPLIFESIILKWKEPSPLVNPATQNGSVIPLNLYSGLFTGTAFGKARTNFLERPQLRELFNPTIFNRPFSVKCSLRLIILRHSLNIK